MTIEIVIRDENDEIIATRLAIESFETAEENLGKLKEWYNAKTSREDDLARGKTA